MAGYEFRLKHDGKEITSMKMILESLGVVPSNASGNPTTPNGSVHAALGDIVAGVLSTREEELERELIGILESENYRRAVRAWERKQQSNIGGIGGEKDGMTNSNNEKNGRAWGESFSKTSLLSYDSAHSNGQDAGQLGSGSGTPKKSKRFSGLDYYRRKLFSPNSSPPNSPSHSRYSQNDRSADNYHITDTGLGTYSYHSSSTLFDPVS